MHFFFQMLRIRTNLSLKATKGASGFKFPIFCVFKVQQLELDTAQRRKLEVKVSQIWAHLRK
jgi:hypothetical protein